MTIADSSRTSTSNNDQYPVMRLCWQVAGRTCDNPSTDVDRRPNTDCRLFVQVQPANIVDTGLLRAWLEVSGSDHEIVSEQHVDIQRAQAHGWTHIEVQGKGLDTISLSLHDGVLRYLRTDLPERAGLPGGSYAAATYEERLETPEDPETA
jgi:hypothetical protein